MEVIQLTMQGDPMSRNVCDLCTLKLYSPLRCSGRQAARSARCEPQVAGIHQCIAPCGWRDVDSNHISSAAAAAAAWRAGGGGDGG